MSAILFVVIDRSGDWDHIRDCLRVRVGLRPANAKPNAFPLEFSDSQASLRYVWACAIKPHVIYTHTTQRISLIGYPDSENAYWDYVRKHPDLYVFSYESW